MFSLSQQRVEYTKTKKGILYIFSLSDSVQESVDNYDKSPADTVFFSIKPLNGLNQTFKISAKEIPEKFKESMIKLTKDEALTKSFFENTYKKNFAKSSGFEIEKNSFKSINLDNKNFYQIAFKDNQIKHYHVSTIYKNNIIALMYSSKISDFNDGIEEFNNFKSSLIIN